MERAGFDKLKFAVFRCSLIGPEGDELLPIDTSVNQRMERTVKLLRSFRLVAWDDEKEMSWSRTGVALSLRLRPAMTLHCQTAGSASYCG